MGVISAKSGAISMAGVVQTTVKDITIDPQQSAAMYGASNTQGSVARADGNADWKATFTVYGSGATATVFPGDTGTLIAYTGAADWTGNYIVDECEIECDIKGGGLVSARVSVSGNGPLTTQASSGVSDSTGPIPLPVKNLKVNYDGSDRTDATGWRLTIKSENKEYHSAATYDSGTGLNWAKRVAGRKDAAGSWTELEGTPSLLPVIGETGGTKILKLYVTPTTFYEVKWPKVISVNHPIPVEAGDIVEATIGWEFNGLYAAAGVAGVVGYVKKPSTSAWWP